MTTPATSPVLVGVDGSAGSGDALAFAGVLAAAAQRPLALARVCVCTDDEADERLAQARAALQAVPLPADTPRHVLRDDSVAGGLQRVADHEAAGAIVVGSPARTAFGRVQAGTVALHLLHGSPCSVALAPRGYAERQLPELRRILVGYSDTEEARSAVRVAAGLAHATGATVRLVTVTDELTPGSDPARQAAAADLDSTLRRLASSVATESRVLSGDPVTRLIEETVSWGDLIVTGSRGYGPSHQVLLGSVSAGLLAESAIPVLVTPRAARNELVTSTPAASLRS